jgi:FixJ family two-component response regulator
MTTQDPIIYLVDDDPDVRRSLERLFATWGLAAQTFASPEEFLATGREDRLACLIIDLKLPGMSGLELQERLQALNQDIPIIFISAYGTVAESVRAMKSGALEFLEKPIAETTLIEAVTRAIEKHRHVRQEAGEIKEIGRRFATLTPREYQVLSFVVQGWLNKQIAAQLQLSEITVKVHRRRLMEKLQCSSLAELILLTAKAKLYPPKQSPDYTKV